MTFTDYYKLTRDTTNSCIKISGAIFTSIIAVIAIIFGYKNESASDSIEIFVISFLSGNGIGFIIWFLAILSAYAQVKAKIRFYGSMPKAVIEGLGLILVAKPLNPKYNFIQLEIIDTNSKHPYIFDIYKEYVYITVAIDLRDVNDFQERMIDIQKRYKKEQVSLTGWGLRKSIKLKDWEKVTFEEVEMILEELKAISNRENFKIINRNYK